MHEILKIHRSLLKQLKAKPQQRSTSFKLRPNYFQWHAQKNLQQYVAVPCAFNANLIDPESCWVRHLYDEILTKDTFSYLYIF